MAKIEEELCEAKKKAAEYQAMIAELEAKQETNVGSSICSDSIANLLAFAHEIRANMAMFPVMHKPGACKSFQQKKILMGLLLLDPRNFQR